MLREVLLAIVLATALGLVVFGVSLFCVPAAWIVCGVGVAAIGALFLIDAA